MEEKWPEGLPRPEEMPERAIDIYKEYMLFSGHTVKGLWGIMYGKETDPETLSRIVSGHAGNELIDCIQSVVDPDDAEAAEEEPERTNHVPHGDDEQCSCCSSSNAPVVVIQDEDGAGIAILRRSVTAIRCSYKLRHLNSVEEVRRVLDRREKEKTNSEFENITKSLVIPSET